MIPTLSGPRQKLMIEGLPTDDEPLNPVAAQFRKMILETTHRALNAEATLSKLNKAHIALKETHTSETADLNKQVTLRDRRIIMLTRENMVLKKRLDDIFISLDKKYTQVAQGLEYSYEAQTRALKDKIEELKKALGRSVEVKAPIMINGDKQSIQKIITQIFWACAFSAAFFRACTFENGGYEPISSEVALKSFFICVSGISLMGVINIRDVLWPPKL